MGLAGAVLLAGLAGAVLWRRWRRARAQLDAARAEVGSARQALHETRARAAELARRLNQAERLAAVGTMSAQIAHQLRNPLTSLGLYVQLLGDELCAREGRDDREASELLTLVQNELEAMVEITDHYLQYARLPEMVRAPVDVNHTVREMVKFLRREVERKGITLSTRLAPGRAAVAADRRLLGFALMNLLKNALEAMGPGGRLRVKTCQENGAVEVHVSDTGPGVPQAEAERIFEPFYTTKDSGSGLGLSLSRHIVEKHDGSLTCQSMAGVGTTFVVRLPVWAGEPRGNDGSDERSNGPGGG